MTTTATQTWNILNIKTDETVELGLSNLAEIHEILRTANTGDPSALWVAVEA